MRKTPLILLASALPLAVHAANTEFSYGGYIKMDAMMSTYSDGDVSAADTGREYYTPNSTPTSAGTGKETSSFDMSAKSSRFNFKTVTTLENGEKITGFVEMDFLSGGGNELVSNSYNPRLRHAFFTYNNLTFGQTWSTFMNPGALPETVDFLGVTEGTVFIRQAQIRYTMGDFQFSLENPESGVAVNTNSTTAVQKGSPTDDAGLPDVVARYNLKQGNNAFTVAAIGRQIAIQDGAGLDESTTGFGVNVTGVIKLGSDDLKFSYSNGDIARYVGAYTATADADLINGKLEATSVSAGFVGYRHFWSDKVRSTLAYSFLDADYGTNDTVAADRTKKSASTRLNLMYSPAKEVTYGVEYSVASRELVNGNDGDMNRLQFTAKYSF